MATYQLSNNANVNELESGLLSGEMDVLRKVNNFSLLLIKSILV
jgi:hypothetical protein